MQINLCIGESKSLGKNWRSRKFLLYQNGLDIIGMVDSITSTIHMGKGCHNSPPWLIKAFWANYSWRKEVRFSIFSKTDQPKDLFHYPFYTIWRVKSEKKRVPPWKPGNWERAIDESHRAADLRQAHPILQTTLWQRTRYPQQTTASWLRFFPGKKTGAETERIRSGANNHHVTWFILAFDFKISWIPISGTTRIPLTKTGGPTLKNNYPARGCSHLLTYVSPMFSFGIRKKQLVEISWNTAPLEQSKTSTLATPTVDCWWTKFCTTAFSNNHLRRLFNNVFPNQKFNGLKRWWAKCIKPLERYKEAILCYN